MKKHIKRIIKLLIIVVIISIISLIGTNLYMVKSTEKRIITLKELKNQKNIDCIIVLGSGMIGEKPTPILEARLTKGIELYNQNITSKIIMSGDHGKEYHDEVNLMKNYAIAKGVPSKNIFMDHAGFSTYESMYRAKEIFKVKKAVIVTQKYHIYRSIYIANKLGINAYGVITDPKEYNNYNYRELREFIARNKDYYKVIIKPSPKYLGKTIPISGDGDLTNDKN